MRKRISALILLQWTGDGGEMKQLSKAIKKKEKEKERHYPTYFLDGLRPITIFSLQIFFRPSEQNFKTIRPFIQQRLVKNTKKKKKNYGKK